MLKKPKTLNNGTWTESEFISHIQNHLRRFRGWKPPYAVKKAAARKSQSTNKKLKYEYLCNCCKQYFPSKEVQADHIDCVINPLEGFIDFNTYIKRLFVEKDAYQILCLSCHSLKSKGENLIRSDVKKEKIKEETIRLEILPVKKTRKKK